MKTHKGADFFDSEDFFQVYQRGRHGSDTPNATLEEPVILELIGNPRGLDILDLGCGDAIFGVQLLKAGCKRYVGLESSENMARLGAVNLHGLSGAVVHEPIEAWSYPPEQFDLAVSRLALHYIEDFGRVCHLVDRTLRPGGRFVFSTIHPVITSSDQSGGGMRGAWTVDNYFDTGTRSVQFMGGLVEQYHRTIEDFYADLQDAGFTVEQLRESRPRRQHFTDQELYLRRRRIPLFIFFAALKPRA